MKLTPDELRGVYGRATSQVPGGHLAADVLARLLSGDVTDDERRTAVAHVAICSRCSEDVRVASPVADALSKEAGGARTFQPAAWRRPAVLLAAAAAVLIAGGLAVRVWPRGGFDSAYRSAAEPGLKSLLPEDARLPRRAPVLRWTGAPAGTTFDVVLANEKLDVLARFPGMKDPRLVVPESVLSALPSGSKLVWKVAVVQPDGSRTDSATFIAVVE